MYKSRRPFQSKKTSSRSTEKLIYFSKTCFKVERLICLKGKNITITQSLKVLEAESLKRKVICLGAVNVEKLNNQKLLNYIEANADGFEIKGD